MDQHNNTKLDFTAGNIISISIESFKENISFYSVLGFVLTLFGSIFSLAFSDESELNWLFIVIVFLALIALYAKFAIMVHRSILLNEVDFLNLTTWDKNENAFMLWIILIFLFVGLLIGGPLYFLALFGSGQSEMTPLFSLLLLIALITFSIISSRLAILFPSIAVEKKLTLSECWEITSHFKGSMYALVIGFPFLTNIILKRIPDDGLLWIIIGSVISVIVTIIEIIIISHAYNTLVEDMTSEDKLNL